MKRVFYGLIAVLLLAGCTEKREQREKNPVRVKTEVVGSSNSNSRQQYVGIVEENEGTAVSFTGMGVVRRVLVDEGQPVKRGQLIAIMDDTQAQNVLAGAEAQMAQANDALERYKMLHDNGSLPEVQWVEIQSKVAQAKSQLDIARKNLADCRLVAPVSGIVGRKQVVAGETALPSQAVVTILDIGTVKVKVAIPETEIGDIGPRTTSYIQVKAINRTFVGGRIEKGVQADALTHTYDIRINVANGERKLLPGMVASVSFEVNRPHVSAQPSLPVTAIQKKADGSLFVWTVEKDNTARRSQVTIGKTMGNRVVILNGVKTNQRIVTEGYQKLSEGTQVIY